MAAVPSAVLFDFFGTLVHYEPDRGRLAYPSTHALAQELGFRGDHDTFSEQWNSESTRLELATAGSHREFSMLDAAEAFCHAAGLTVGQPATAELAAEYLREWQLHVRPVAGATAMLHRLADSFRLGVVSNTHDPAMVPTMLRDMGVDSIIAVTVLSIDHGFRKPHPSIYAAALSQLGLAPTDVLFVGDSFTADYEAPARMGMSARLIGSDERSVCPAEHRLRSVLDVEAELADLSG